MSGIVRKPRRLAVDPRPGHYYVSVIDAGRHALLLGPFRYHRQARRFVRAVREHAEEVDPWATFYAFGTCRCSGGARPGIFNDALDFRRGRSKRGGRSDAG